MIKKETNCVAHFVANTWQKKDKNMEKKDIKLVLKNPHKDILNYALSIVNLSEKELQAITLVDIKGNTEDYASIEMNASIRKIQRLRSSAYNKLDNVWSNSTFIQVLLQMLKNN